LVVVVGKRACARYGYKRSCTLQVPASKISERKKEEKIAAAEQINEGDKGPRRLRLRACRALSREVAYSIVGKGGHVAGDQRSIPASPTSSGRWPTVLGVFANERRQEEDRRGPLLKRNREVSRSSRAAKVLDRKARRRKVQGGEGEK
jgi:hypothetical protein